MTQHVVVIGAGFGGMSAAAYLAKAGYEVTVLEKNSRPGGRAAVLKKKGFTWDLGPSWYMMPDVFEEFFADFDKKVPDFYELKELSPSYRVFDDDPSPIDIGSKEAALNLFERLNPGDGAGLEQLLSKTELEYNTVRSDILTTDWLSFTQVFRPNVLKFLFDPEMLGSYDKRISLYVKQERLKHILEFMTVFMGGSPKNIPGMYSLLTHVDMNMHIWYPMGGFGAVSKAFEALCKSLGVKFRYNVEVAKITTSHGRVKGIRPTEGEPIECDAIVANADYQHVQTKLLDEPMRDIPEESWKDKTLSPSGLLICLGVKKQLPGLLHHNLFFDTDWEGHFSKVFDEKVWSEDPLFYVCAPSKSDPSVAPEGCENLFILAPQASGKQPDQAVIDQTVRNIIARIEDKIGTTFAADITVKDVKAQDYFTSTFNAYNGNAFGLAHTLLQSAPFRPKLRSKKVNGLYFVGQYTNPGTGVPMVVLSGKAVAKVVQAHE